MTAQCLHTVTGAAGYTGGCITQLLLQQGHLRRQHRQNRRGQDGDDSSLGKGLRPLVIKEGEVGMKPYYEHGGVTIYHGDCREILHTLTYDTVITDPVWPNSSPMLTGADRPYQLLSESAALWECKRAAVHLGCNSDPRILQAIPTSLPFFRVMWLRYARPHYLGRLLYGNDVAYLFGEPPAAREGNVLIPGEFIDPDNQGKQTSHPTPRKVGHVQWLMSKWTNIGDIVLDPFAGGGTTLRAAKNLGLAAIGIEIEERLCEMSAEYLRQETMAL